MFTEITPDISDDQQTSALSDDPATGTGTSDDPDTDISPEELDLLDNAGTEENDELTNDELLDSTDEDGDTLNEDDDLTGDDLDVPGSEDDDLNESIGEEDEENNSYSASDQDDDMDDSQI